MSDEIRDENTGDLEKWFNQMKGDGKMGCVPNMTGLSNEDKEKIAKGALMHCTELLMKTYMSLGIHGEAVLGMEDGISGNKFRLHFKATEKRSKESEDLSDF